eukprot:scaffold98574_cov60-Phaeocystis_antarctica.AAC.4
MRRAAALQHIARAADHPARRAARGAPGKSRGLERCCAPPPLRLAAAVPVARAPRGEVPRARRHAARRTHAPTHARRRRPLVTRVARPPHPLLALARVAPRAPLQRALCSGLGGARRRGRPKVVGARAAAAGLR